MFLRSRLCIRWRHLYRRDELAQPEHDTEHAPACACQSTCEQAAPCEPGTNCPGEPCFRTVCGHGHCVVESGAPQCVCDPGYAIEEITGRCLSAPTPCTGVDCSGHGTCAAVDAHASCTCDPGFVAMGLQCLPVEQCPAPPSPPATCPDVCSGGCPQGVCVFDCRGLSDCQHDVIDCPDGMACRVECAGISSCQSAQIRCPADGNCDVECSNTSACQGSSVTCGDGPCASTCAGLSASTSLQCGSSCACNPSCPG